MTALAFRLARREMRSGLSGFRIFFACLALGVASIAGVGSLADALLTGMASQGRVLLGGDVAVPLVHRQMTAQEHAFIMRHGRTSDTISMRGMAYALKNGAEAERQLIELKAVDGAYPLYGSVTLSPNAALAADLACSKNICGAVAEQSLLDHLHVARSALLHLGSQDYRVTGVLTSEPDRLSGGFSLGPHVIVSSDGLARAGLVTLGSLIEYSYRVAMPLDASIPAFRRDAEAAFPDGGWQISDRDNAAPGIRRFVEQVTMFLTLVGLTALAVGGVGAGQAVGAFLDRKRAEIATLKALGAEGGTIFLMFFIQVMAVALAAVAVGLIIGVALPFVVEAFFGAEIPAPAKYAVYAGPLWLAAAFGLLSAAAFAIPPLARTPEIAPASLFRDIVAPANARARLPYLALAAGAGAIVVVLALLIAPSAVFAAYFLGGVAGGLIVLRLFAEGLRWGLRRIARPKRPAWRLALANLTRPGAATASVVVALGLGLTLLTTVMLLDGTIAAQVKDSLPGTAPTFFFIDIQPDESDAFDKTVARFPTTSGYKRTPMIRGRITALNGVAAKDAKVEQSARWALAGDRGISYAATPPKGTDITDGKWWPANYAGPTLISFDAELAAGVHLKLGRTLTLNRLRREVHLVRRGGRGGDASEARRHDHPERARPRDHRQHRQSARRRFLQRTAELRADPVAGPDRPRAARFPRQRPRRTARRGGDVSRDHRQIPQCVD